MPCRGPRAPQRPRACPCLRPTSPPGILASLIPSPLLQTIQLPDPLAGHLCLTAAPTLTTALPCPDLCVPAPPPGPPYATTVPEYASVRAGETLQLQCLAHGTPPLSFQWSRVGGSLPRRVTARNEMLRFEPAAPEDSGRYHCRVTNKVGSAEAFAQVLVQGEQPWLRQGRRASRRRTFLVC